LDEKQMPLSREGELAALWKKAGLHDVEQRPLDIKMRFRSFADYWDPFVHGQGPAGAYMRALDEAHLSALRNEVKRRLKRAKEDEAFELPARAWAVRGTVATR
jgi:hypothetical protein